MRDKLAAAIAVILFIAGPVAFGGGPTAQRSTFEDTVTAVGADTITIQTGRNAGDKVSHVDSDGDVTGGSVSNEKKLKVNSFSRIVVDDLPGTLSDVKAGMIVKFELGGDPDVADTIQAHTVPPAAAATPTPKPVPNGNTAFAKPAFRKITGDVVISVSSTRITVGQPGGKMARAFYITPTTGVMIDGAQASASGLQEGMAVEVRGDSTSADEIDARTGRK